MTAQNRATNKAKFENGDTPQGSDYVDLIDSFLSIADTGAQSIASQVTFSAGLSTTTVSAANVWADNYHDVSADSVTAGTISASAYSGTQLNVSTVSAATLNAAAMNVTTANIVAVSASAARLTTLGVGTAAPSAGFWLIGSEGNAHLDISTTTQASGGGGGAVPTSAAAFGIITVSGTKYYIPLFNVK